MEKELFVISTVWCSNITLHPWNPLTIDSLTPRKKSLRPVSGLALGAGFMARTWSYGVSPSGELKAVGFFHDFVDGKLGNSLHKRCAPTPVEWALLTPKQVQWKCQ